MKVFLAASYLSGSVFFSHFRELYLNSGCINLTLKGAVIYLFLLSVLSKSVSRVRSDCNAMVPPVRPIFCKSDKEPIV